MRNLETLSDKFIKEIAFIDYELTGPCGSEFEWFLRGERKKILDMIEYFNLDRELILSEAKALQMTKVG